MSDIKRIKWIDGLRGLACIGIFYHHFLLHYVPESYYGKSLGECSKVWLYLSESPLGVLINGNFFVFTFILVSGFVVCKRVINTRPSELGLFVINRYLKLVIPIFVCEVFYYIFYKLGIGGQLFTEEDNIRSFVVVLENAFIKVLCDGDTTFAGAFWMMNVIFIGGILVIAIATIGWKNKTYAMYVFGAISLTMLTQKSYYFSVLFAGACLYCFLEKIQINRNLVINIVGILIAILLGGYPTGVVPESGIYRFVTLPFTNDSAYIYHWLASITLFISIYSGRYIKKILCINAIQWLGGISYTFYVFHNFARKIFDPVYYLIWDYWGSRTIAIVVDSSIVIVVLFGICEVYKKMLFPIINKIVKGILKPLIEP